jgi:hypothetical protein
MVNEVSEVSEVSEANNTLQIIEKNISETVASGVQWMLFFLKPTHQACLFSVFHYVIFAIGFYVFFFVKYQPYRILVYVCITFAAISYEIFNKCLFTSIEYCLSPIQNPIQEMMSTYFGEAIEGNESSKTFLSIASLSLGSIIIMDVIKNKKR